MSAKQWTKLAAKKELEVRASARAGIVASKALAFSCSARSFSNAARSGGKNASRMPPPLRVCAPGGRFAL